MIWIILDHARAIGFESCPYVQIHNPRNMTTNSTNQPTNNYGLETFLRRLKFSADAWPYYQLLSADYRNDLIVSVF